MKDRQRAIEADMARLEGTIAEHEQELANYVSAEDSARRAAEIDQSRRKLETLMTEWEAITRGLEEAGG
jgi:hypothetical protein